MPSIFHKRCRHKLIKLENSLHISAITASACKLQHAGNIIYEVVTKTFRTDTVKIVKLTIRPIGAITLEVVPSRM